jgi:hypothetical protein
MEIDGPAQNMSSNSGKRSGFLAYHYVSSGMRPAPRFAEELRSVTKRPATPLSFQFASTGGLKCYQHFIHC